jgi:hypothetical protein
MSAKHKRIDELPILDLSWCPRFWSPEAGLFILLDERPPEEEIVEESYTKLAKTLGINVLLDEELIDEALQARAADAAQKIEKPIRQPYVFSKLVPVGRTPEGELIVVSFELTIWDDLRHLPGPLIETRWTADVCAPQHYWRWQPRSGMDEY